MHLLVNSRNKIINVLIKIILNVILYDTISQYYKYSEYLILFLYIYINISIFTKNFNQWEWTFVRIW